MNLLITGGAGFIGCHCVRAMLNRPEVKRLVNLDCLTYAGSLMNLDGVEHHPKYVFERVDLRDLPSLVRVLREHEVTHILHLAAESHVDRSIVRPDDFISTNVLGTFNLLEAVRSVWGKEMSGKRLLHISTDEVYGSLGDEGYFTEASPYAPNSPYSASKAASDLLVRAYGKTYGVPVVTTHCVNNYGPNQFPEKLIPVVIQSVMMQTPIPVYGSGLQVRDWLFVEDHVMALWAVLTRGRLGESYNIGGNTERLNIRVVEAICDLLDEIAPRLGGNSRRLITFVADRPGHDRRYALDSSKILGELGWQPSTNFEHGLRATIRWYLQSSEWLEAMQARRRLEPFASF